MKTHIHLLLAFVCSFVLVSCGKIGGENAGGIDFTIELDRDALAAMVRENAAEGTPEDVIMANVADIARNATDIAVGIIRNRIVKQVGVEPRITRSGEYQINVRIPGVSPENRDEFGRLLTTVAHLEFRLVSQTPAHDLLDGTPPPGYMTVDLPNGKYFIAANSDEPPPAAAELYNHGKPPAQFVFMLQRQRIKGLDRDVYTPIYVSRRPLLTGANIAKAGTDTDPFGRPQITLSFNAQGRREFADITAKYAANGPQNQSGVGRQLAIVLDGIVYSAPVLQAHITTGSAVISGDFTAAEARELKNLLNAGALPAPLRIINE